MALLPIHDRNPLKWIRFHWANVALIAITVAVFLWQLTLDQAAFRQVTLAFGTVPAAVLGNLPPAPGLGALPPQVTVVTSAFLHANWLHLFANMMFLWVFGDNVEDCLGHWRYIGFYLLCAAGSDVVYIATAGEPLVPAFGASGAVSGVLGAYLLLYPTVRVWVLIWWRLPVLLPAGLVLGGWFVLQLLSAAEASPGDGVAWWSHIGGFVIGMLLVIPLRRPEARLLSGLRDPPGDNSER
jgi:membrane associated rhomboid family serine protease